MSTNISFVAIDNFMEKQSAIMGYLFHENSKHENSKIFSRKKSWSLNIQKDKRGLAILKWFFSGLV